MVFRVQKNLILKICIAMKGILKVIVYADLG